MYFLTQFLLGALPFTLFSFYAADQPMEFCTRPTLSTVRDRSIAVGGQRFYPISSVLDKEKEESFAFEEKTEPIRRTIDPTLSPVVIDPFRSRHPLLAHPLAKPTLAYAPAPLLPGAEVVFCQPEAAGYEYVDPEPVDLTKKFRRRRWIDPLLDTKISALAPMRGELTYASPPMKLGEAYPFPVPVAKEYVIPEAIAKVDLTLSGTALKGGKEGQKLKKDLFSKVFGKKEKSKSAMANLPVILNNRSAGTVGAEVGDSAETTVLDTASVIAMLEPVAKSEVIESIKKYIGSSSTMTFQDLYDVGLEAMLDSERMQIRVFLPPEMRITRLHRLRREPKREKDISQPATLSAYTNLLFKQDFYHYEMTNGASSSPSRLDFESVINYKNLVFEAYGGFNTDRDYLFQRGDLRLTRPDPDSMVRYVAGDLRVPVRGMQSSPPLGGIGYYKDYELQPYLVVQPVSRRKILLRTPSEVEILVNGVKVKGMKLDAGEHDLVDFPGGVGANDIDVRVIDQFGHEEIISFPFIYEPTNLAKGLHNYGYSFGFPFYDELGERHYRMSEPTLSMFHRYGVTDQLTMGGHFQMNLEQGLGGVEGTYSTLMGVFEGEVSMSRDVYGRIDGAGVLKFRRFKDLLVPFEQQKSWSAEITYTGPHFTAIGADSMYNHVAVGLRASYNQRLFWDIHGRISESYQFVRGDLPNQFSTTLSLSKKFVQGPTVRLDLSHKKPKGEPQNFNMFLSVTNNFTKQNQTVAYTRDFDSQVDNLMWQYQSPLPVGGWNLGANASHDIDSYKVGGKAAYTSRRFKTQIDHDTNVYTHREDGARPKTQFRFDTALAYADGSFAVSRPIYNSFAIVDRKKALKPYDIGANRRNKVYTVMADKFGPGVVHTLVPYREAKISLEADNLPEGISVGKNVFWLRPTYKSGTVIHVGNDAVVFLTGTLLKPDGSPVNMAGGMMQYLGTKSQPLTDEELKDPNNKPVIFFTDKTGKFGQPGFKPGRYQLTLFTKKKEKVSFEIPEDTMGIYDIGNIYLEPVEVPMIQRSEPAVTPQPGAIQE